MVNRIDRLPPRVIDRAGADDSVVKSAQRVLEILEFFDDYRTPATVAQVCDSLGYPQSSTSALLKSLQKLGYLHFDPRARTYISSPRVALLGAWIGERFSREGDLVQFMRELNDETGDAVILAVRNGLRSQYIHVIQGTRPNARWIGTGHLRPLAASGSGYALLSTMPEREVLRLVMRINAETKEHTDLLNTRAVLDGIAEVRRVGYAVAHSPAKNCGMVAAPLRAQPDKPAMVIGICGEGARLATQASELGPWLLRRIEQFHRSPHGLRLNVC